MKGSPIDLEKEKGKKATLVELWATWCPPCRNTIPHLTSIAKKYKDLNVIGITNETDVDKLNQFINEMGDKMDYNVAMDKEGHFIRDYAAKYKVNSIPHAFLIDKDGYIVWHDHPNDPSLEFELKRIFYNQS